MCEGCDACDGQLCPIQAGCWLSPARRSAVSRRTAGTRRRANGVVPVATPATSGTLRSIRSTPRNVRNLKIAWIWRGDNFGSQPEYKNETTPLMVDGVLYFTAGDRRSVVAADPGTGETLWVWRLDEGGAH